MAGNGSRKGERERRERSVGNEIMEIGNESRGRVRKRESETV